MSEKNYIYTFLTAVFCFVFLLPLFFNKTYAGCKESRPGGPPLLHTATPGNGNVTLVWGEAPDPVTYYLVRYGPSKEQFLYGYPNIGGRGTTSFTVSGLTNGQKYYFQVQAVNGCKPGKFSSTMSATPGSSGGGGGGGGGDEISSQELLVLKIPKNLSIYKEVLGTSSAAVKEKPTPTKPVVKIAGDTQKENCAFNCYSWPLLISEALILLILFHLARKNPSVKPMYSILIPVLIYVIFYEINGGCTSYKFLCRYFLPLIIIIYVSIFISHKYFFLKSDTKSKITRL